MPWQETSTMERRSAFVTAAQQPGVNIRALCRRYAISPTTAYKWLARAASGAASPLSDRSRRPRQSPGQTAAPMEQRIVAVRDAHPAWGGRKLRRRLQDQGERGVPSASTITSILRRTGRLDPAQASKHRAFIRFEAAAPNALWQMDFKGHVPLAQGRCHPLTVLDDHSRYLVGLAACADEQTATVQAQLITLFRRHGLPDRLLCDNGGPWGTTGSGVRYSRLGVWLLQLDIPLSHGRPYHPQTQGKDERLHRSLVAEVLGRSSFLDLAAAQQAFDQWQTVYNEQRPHAALALAVPASRYQPSRRPFPEVLPAIEYPSGSSVRRVSSSGHISFRGQDYDLGNAFAQQPVALSPTATDAMWTVYFLHHEIARLDVRTGTRQ
jgi:transposase InsO family protein